MTSNLGNATYCHNFTQKISNEFICHNMSADECNRKDLVKLKWK